MKFFQVSVYITIILLFPLRLYSAALPVLSEKEDLEVVKKRMQNQLEKKRNYLLAQKAMLLKNTLNTINSDLEQQKIDTQLSVKVLDNLMREIDIHNKAVSAFSEQNPNNAVGLAINETEKNDLIEKIKNYIQVAEKNYPAIKKYQEKYNTFVTQAKKNFDTWSAQFGSKKASSDEVQKEKNALIAVFQAQLLKLNGEAEFAAIIPILSIFMPSVKETHEEIMRYTQPSFGQLPDNMGEIISPMMSSLKEMFGFQRVFESSLVASLENCTISGDGSTIAIQDKNNVLHIFVRNHDGTYPKVPRPVLGSRLIESAPYISFDGRTIVARSVRDTLVIFVRDQDGNYVSMPTGGTGGLIGKIRVSANGSTIALKGDNDNIIIFERSLDGFWTEATIIADLAWHVFMSADGSTIVVTSRDNAWRVFIRAQDGTFPLTPTAILNNDTDLTPVISADGRTILCRDFSGKIRIFVRSHDGTYPPLPYSIQSSLEESASCAISADGLTVAAVGFYDSLEIFTRTQDGTYSPTPLFTSPQGLALFTLPISINADGSIIVAQGVGVDAKIKHTVSMFRKKGDNPYAIETYEWPAHIAQRYVPTISVEGWTALAAEAGGTISALLLPLDPDLYSNLTTAQLELLAAIHTAWKTETRDFVMQLNAQHYKEYESLPLELRRRIELLTPRIIFKLQKEDSSSKTKDLLIGKKL